MKDDNDRLRAGTLPHDPEADAVPMTDPNAPKAPPWEARWLPLAPDTFTQPPPRREWLLSDVLPLGKVGMLVAEGGAGKTTALCQLALAVATGKPWLGMPVANVGRVLLVLGEEDAEEVRRRMYNAARSMKLTGEETHAALDRIIAVPLAGVPCSMLKASESGEFTESEFAAWLHAKLGEPAPEPWRLVLLDPLSRFAGTDAEKDNAAATRFVQAVEALATHTGATALVAHHSTKTARKEGEAATHAARGSSALTDGVRWVASLNVETHSHKDPDAARRLSRIATFKVTKSNYAKHPDAIALRYDDESHGALVVCDASDLALLASAREAAKRKPEAMKLASVRSGDDGFE